MKRLTAINFIYQFTWAAIAITLPLYLIKKEVNVEEIGLILSVIPLAMVFFKSNANQSFSPSTRRAITKPCFARCSDSA